MVLNMGQVCGIYGVWNTFVPYNMEISLHPAHGEKTQQCSYPLIFSGICLRHHIIMPWGGGGRNIVMDSIW